ncbi:uncharacterized protein LOC123297698 [Chrysoperla carnea]|uniref:uncharacterized protein LOC123297698 n=1 Tax=Chrysoperla carnea TaxID=189513 RepID=UPI001D087CE8|nr:uncharacterized protein LOC123297698 [Chrysoperla carnea]
MSLNDLDISEFLNNYKTKLKEEKERLESHFQSKDNNTTSEVQNGAEEAVNNIRKTSNINPEKSTVAFNQQINHPTQKPTKASSSNSENISMLRKETSKDNKENDLKEDQAFFGFGEYEKRRQKFLEERRLDYKEYLEKQKQNYLHKPKKNRSKKETQFNVEDVFDKLNSTDVNLNSNINRLQESKSVQTDIPNVELPKSDVPPSNIFDINNSVSDENSVKSSDNEYFDMNATRPNQLAVKIDKVQIGTQNIIVPGYRSSSIDSSNGFARDTSPKARYLADLKHTYFPSFTKTNENPADNEDYLEKKLKWEKARQHEKYHEDLRKQIEEKQRIALEIAERERCQEAALTRRVEKQLQQLRMEHEDEKAKQAFEENYQRYTENKWNATKNSQKRDIYNFNNVPYDQNVNGFYQPHKTKSENSLINKSNNNKVPYSFNIPETSIFSTASTSKLNKENRYFEEMKRFENYSQEVNRNSRRNDTKQKTILDDSFPVPILRAQSPPNNNSKYTNIKETNTPNSPAMQQVEAKWMVPAVQKNIVKRSNLPSIGESKNVLTQLGAIRLQLQQEQLRLNQTLKNKQTKNTK